MSYVKTKSFFKYIAINNSSKYLLINDVKIFNNIADIGDREYLLLIIPKKPLDNENLPSVSLNDIKNFLETDNSVITIKAISNNAIPGMNNIVSGNEKIINIFKEYDTDKAIDDRGDTYKLYLFKRTDAYSKELQNKEDIMIMYEAIAEQYESTIGL